MIRPVQIMLQEFHANDEKVDQSGKKPWGIGGKRAESELAAYYKRQQKALSVSRTAKKFEESLELSKPEILNAQERLEM
jgi:hypothetical protein